MYTIIYIELIHLIFLKIKNWKEIFNVKQNKKCIYLNIFLVLLCFCKKKILLYLTFNLIYNYFLFKNGIFRCFTIHWLFFFFIFIFFIFYFHFYSFLIWHLVTSARGLHIEKPTTQHKSNWLSNFFKRSDAGTQEPKLYLSVRCK